MERAARAPRTTAHPAGKTRESAAAQAGARRNPVLRLQQDAGNHAVAAWLRGSKLNESSSGPLATTTDGETTIRASALAHPRLHEVAAHEAVHRAQFGAAGARLGTVAELETDAAVGAEALLAGSEYQPKVRAARGMNLAYPGGDDVDNPEAKSLSALGTKPNASIQTTQSQSGGAPSEAVDRDFHLEVMGSGERGSIRTTTDVSLHVDPFDPSIGIDRTPNDQLQTMDASAYPVVVRYTRTIDLTDSDGRECNVEVSANAYLSRDNYAKQTQFAPPSPDSLVRLSAEKTVFWVRLNGKGPIQKYSVIGHLDEGQASLSELSHSVAQQLAEAKDTPLDDGMFVAPEETSGDQFHALDQYLRVADYHESVDRLVNAGSKPERTKVEQGGEADAVSGGKTKTDDAQSDSALNDLLGSILKGGVIGVAIVAAILAVAAIFSIPVAVAALVVGLTIATTMFLMSLKNRWKEAQAAGNISWASIFSTAVLDTIGVSQIDEALENRSLLTHKELNLSVGERVGMGGAGVLQLFMTFMGVKDFAEGKMPAPDRSPADPDVAALPDRTALEVDASQYQTPEDYLNAIRSSRNNPTGVGQSWDSTRFPNGPNMEWQPGDPIDMPDARGNYPKWDTARPRFWRNRAAAELEARGTGSRARNPQSTDPISAMSDADLEDLRDTATSRVRSPRSATTGKAAEIEHFGVQQQVGRWLQDAGFDANDARRITGVADPYRLMDVSPVEHAFFDAEAHGFGRLRADPWGDMWQGTPTADPRVNDPLTFMRDSELTEIANKAASDPSIDLSRVPRLLNALRAEAARRGLPLQF